MGNQKPGESLPFEDTSELFALPQLALPQACLRLTATAVGSSLNNSVKFLLLSNLVGLPPKKMRFFALLVVPATAYISWQTDDGLEYGAETWRTDDGQEYGAEWLPRRR